LRVRRAGLALRRLRLALAVGDLAVEAARLGAARIRVDLISAATEIARANRRLSGGASRARTFAARREVLGRAALTADQHVRPAAKTLAGSTAVNLSRKTIARWRRRRWRRWWRRWRWRWRRRWRTSSRWRWRRAWR
jgi:hypothetical protein